MMVLKVPVISTSSQLSPPLDPTYIYHPVLGQNSCIILEYVFEISLRSHDALNNIDLGFNMRKCKTKVRQYTESLRSWMRAWPELSLVVIMQPNHPTGQGALLM